jgi:hypothetical protein
MPTGPEWTQFTPNNQVSYWVALKYKNSHPAQAVIQLNGANLTMIPDNFRAGKSAFNTHGS